MVAGSATGAAAAAAPGWNRGAEGSTGALRRRTPLCPHTTAGGGELSWVPPSGWAHSVDTPFLARPNGGTRISRRCSSGVGRRLADLAQRRLGLQVDRQIAERDDPDRPTFVDHRESAQAALAHELDGRLDRTCLVDRDQLVRADVGEGDPGGVEQL